MTLAHTRRHSPALAAALFATALLSFPIAPAYAAPIDDPPAADAGKAEKPADDLPPVFSKLTLTSARERNKTDGKILVVKATAVWCGPCKRMDKTTWRDDAVVEWFKSKGTAISLDVDQHPEDSQSLNIEAMPTMVAFKEGREVDRVVGYKSGADLLEWLGQVERGETAESRMAARLKAPREGEGALSMSERMDLARELARMGRHEQATEEFAWLWDNMLRLQPSMVGVRVSFMATEMGYLAEAYPASKARFTALRDAAHQRSQAPGRKLDDLFDWIVLNEIIGDDAATLAWFDRAKDNPRAAQAFERVEHRIVPLLERHERWGDVGRLIKNPMSKLAEDARSMKMMVQMSGSSRMGTGDPTLDRQMQEQMLDYARTNFRESAGRLYACLLAADRTDEAGRIADRAIGMDDQDPELMAQALVEAAIRAGQARESLRDLLKPRPLPNAAPAEPNPNQTLEERNRAEHERAMTDRERAERRAAAIEDLDLAISQRKQPE
ncbi:MAG: thioredoxin family protein [Phycisphaeraceae bacterium]|nr:thioredoxin family protein [Phycisphaeraceae bacterium]